MTGITLTDRTTESLVTALDGLAARQRVTGNNVANVDTPGFKASEVSFARALEQAGGRQDSDLKLVSTNAQHLGSQPAPEGIQVTTRQDTSLRLDGNNVDLEREMANLTETTIHYQAAAQMVSRRLGMLRTAINEGRR